MDPSSKSRDHAARPPTRKPAAPAANKPTPPATISVDELLVPPKKPIIGGDAIPIGISIAPDWLKKIVKAALPSSQWASADKPVKLSAASVKLEWNKLPIATIVLGKLALDVVGEKKTFQFSTRLQIQTDPNKLTTGTLSATARLIPAGEKELPPINAEAKLEVQYGDCTAAEVGQLFMAFQPAQPKSTEVVSVRSFVPPPPKPKPPAAPRILKTIQSAFNAPAAAGGTPIPLTEPLPDYLVISIGLDGPDYLAKEVFVGFDFMPQAQTGLLAMSWYYDDPTTLTASAYIDPAAK